MLFEMIQKRGDIQGCSREKGAGTKYPNRWEEMSMDCSSFVTKEKAKSESKGEKVGRFVDKVKDVLLWSFLFSHLESRTSAEREDHWESSWILGKNVKYLLSE